MSTKEIWNRIERKALSLKPVYLERDDGGERLVAIIAVIKHNTQPNEFWVGETTDMLDFTKVERICMY